VKPQPCLQRTEAEHKLEILKAHRDHQCSTRCVTMGFFLPAYITTNRLGIFLFQARIPSHIISDKTLFRKSLRTRSRSEAILLAREIKWGFDEVVNRFHNDPALFTQGLQTLSQYQVKQKNRPTSIDTILTALNSLEGSPREPEEHLARQATQGRQKLYQHNPQHEPATNSLQMERLDQKIDLITQSMPKLDSAPLSQLIAAYLEERKASWNPKSYDKNMKDIKPKLTLLTDIIGDIDSNNLQPSHIVTYKKALFKIPSNRKKGVYKGLSIHEIMNTDIPDQKRLSTETLKNNLGRVSSFLKWLSSNNYSQSNLSDPLLRVAPPSKPAHEQRSIFTSNQLTQLFHSTQYIRGEHKKPSHYWVPLLALFTGARQTELCQLYKADIYQDKESGIWVIDVNAKHEDQSLKRSHHARLIPIHKQLIEMGFIDYVSSLSHHRLFPELRLKRDGYGQTFSRWFCDTYLNKKNCDIKQSGNDSPVFHSFRHTFITTLDHANTPSHQIAHIVGHTPTGGETVNRYTKPNDILKRNEIINGLNYPSVDFNLIQPWGIMSRD